MRRYGLYAIGLLLVLTQLSAAQDTVKEIKKAVEQTAAAAARSVVEQLPAPAPVPCVDLDVLIACVVFDENGEFRLKKDGAEPEVNRAGTIGANLAAKLNEENGNVPQGVTPGTVGANLLLEGLGETDRLQVLERLQLRMRADGSEVHMQNGQRVPRVMATTTSPRGMTNQVSMESIGTLISGTAQITKTGKIGLSITLERSGFGPEEDGTPISVSEENVVRTPRIDSTTLSTQVAAVDGESIVLSSYVQAWGDKVTETFVLLTPTIVKP